MRYMTYMYPFLVVAAISVFIPHNTAEKYGPIKKWQCCKKNYFQKTKFIEGTFCYPCRKGWENLHPCNYKLRCYRPTQDKQTEQAINVIQPAITQNVTDTAQNNSIISTTGHETPPTRPSTTEPYIPNNVTSISTGASKTKSEKTDADQDEEENRSIEEKDQEDDRNKVHEKADNSFPAWGWVVVVTVAVIAIFLSIAVAIFRICQTTKTC